MQQSSADGSTATRREVSETTVQMDNITTTKVITTHDAADDIMTVDLTTPGVPFKNKTKESYNKSDNKDDILRQICYLNPQLQLYGSWMSANERNLVGLPMIPYWQMECWFVDQEVSFSSSSCLAAVVAQNRSHNKDNNSNTMPPFDLFHNNQEQGEEFVYHQLPDNPIASVGIIMHWNFHVIQLLGYAYVGVFVWSVYLWYTIRKRDAQDTRLKQSIVRVVHRDSKLMETLEDITGVSLRTMTGDPFRLHLLDAHAQQDEFQNQKYQMMVMRAIYSLPAIQHQVEEKLQEDYGPPTRLMGYCPPVGLVGLEDLFQSQRKNPSNSLRRFLYQVGGACLLGPPCCHALPDWFYIPCSVFFVGSQIWFLDQFRHPAFSECCQCSKTTLEVAEKNQNTVENPISYDKMNNPKEEDDDDGEPYEDDDSSILPCCTNCNDTGVCTLECEFCQESLNAEYHMLLDHQDIPPDLLPNMPLPAFPFQTAKPYTREVSLI